MASFFFATLQDRLYANIDAYPLLKLKDVLDWSLIETYLKEARKKGKQANTGRTGYHPFSMFKAVLLGQWHNLSDPELERSLVIRADFIVFCGFDDLEMLGSQHVMPISQLAC